MMTMAGRRAWRLCTALAVCVTVTLGGEGVSAQPASAGKSAASASAMPSTHPPAPAASSASGATGPVDIDLCTRNPKLCVALRVANQALIEAARASDGFAGTNDVCTVSPDRCGTTSPQPYLRLNSPTGNPAEVDEGRRLLDWYLADLNCASLCRKKDDVQACVEACGLGTDPRCIPDSGRLKSKPAVSCKAAKVAKPAPPASAN